MYKRQTQISGVAKDKNVARLALVGVEDKPGIAYKVFSLLGQQNINVDIILQSIGRNETQDISFTVRRSDVDQAVALLEEHKASLAFDHIDVDKSVVKVSIVGAGMVDNAGVAAKMFGALYDADINIHMISTSEIKVSVLLDEVDANHAVQALSLIHISGSVPGSVVLSPGSVLEPFPSEPLLPFVSAGF